MKKKKKPGPMLRTAEELHRKSTATDEERALQTLLRFTGSNKETYHG